MIGAAKLQRVLQLVFRQQALDAARKITPGVIDRGQAPDLHHWVAATATAIRPIMLEIFQSGLLHTAAKLGLRAQPQLGPAALAVAAASGRRYEVGNDEAFGARKNFKRQVFKAAGLGGTFDIFNPRVLDAVDAACMVLCRETLATATTDLTTAIQRLRTTLKEGLPRGEALMLLSREIQTIFSDPKRAQLIAVTECLTGDTRITGANIRRLFRRRYRGTGIEIVSNSGENLTGSIHHPVLTQRGWVFLGNLKKSDYLVRDRGRIKLDSRSDSNEQTPPPTLAQIFDTFSSVGTVERIPCIRPDFHGDGTDGYVDVLSPGRFLRYGRLASIQKLLEYADFSPSDVVSPQLIRHRSVPMTRLVVDKLLSLTEVSERDSRLYQNAADFLPGVCRELPLETHHAFTSGVFIDNALRQIIRHRNVASTFVPVVEEVLAGLLEISSNSRIPNESENYRFVAAEVFRDSDTTAAVNIHLDGLKSLRRIENWNTHVYNLETVEGYYVANGYYTKNSARVLNGGQLLAAADSGKVSEKEWVASANSCEQCLELDGKRVKLDQPFVVRGHGPYSVVMHGPLHPRCDCVVEYLFNERRSAA